jgi:hypothetical protein
MVLQPFLHEFQRDLMFSRGRPALHCFVSPPMIYIGSFPVNYYGFCRFGGPMTSQSPTRGVRDLPR